MDTDKVPSIGCADNFVKVRMALDIIQTPAVDKELRIVAEKVLKDYLGS